MRAVAISPAPVAPAPNLLVARKSACTQLDLVIFYGTFGLLLFAPLAFGAVEPWAIFGLELGATLLFIGWVVRQTLSGNLKVSPNPLFHPMFAFAGLILLQLALGRTAYRYDTFSSMLLYCSYGALCLLAGQCVQRSSEAKTLALIFSIYGVVVALFALLQGIASNGKLYWIREPHLGGWIYGPYVNHNHYAGLMEMMVPIPLVFCFTRYAHGTRKLVAAFAVALMASTIFLSGSRGGMLALGVEMAVFTIVVMQNGRTRKNVLALGAILVLLFALLSWIGGGEVAKRLASVHSEARYELSGGTRLAIIRDGVRMFRQKPLLGWGLGVFPVVYPQFRSSSTSFFVNRAHNDYLQLLVEMGALGFATMLWLVVTVYRRSWKRLHGWATNISGAVSLAAILGVTGILVHSFVDSNLQIPANAALFYVLCTIAACEPLLESHRRRKSPSVGPPGNWEPLEPASQ